MTQPGRRWVALVGLLSACGGESASAPGNAQTGAAGSASMAGHSSDGGGAASTGGSFAGTAGGGGREITTGGSPSGGAGNSAMGGGGSGTTGGEGGRGGASVGGQGGGAVTTPEMLVPVVNAFCAAARTCCAKQPDPVDLDACESGFASRDQTSQALARGTVTIAAADLASCLAAYQAAATTCEENGVLDACAGIVQGTISEGGPCQMGSECVGDDPRVCLVTEPNGKVGACKKVPRGKAGDVCNVTCRPNDSCTFTVYGAVDSPLTPCFESDGVYCDHDSVPAKCRAISPAGTACEGDEPCGSLSYCDVGGTQTCRRRSQLGESCGMCIPALSCIGGKCQSPPITVGGTCEGYSLGPY